MKGRNSYGRITSRNRAGGHKKMYRQVDFYRKKIGMSAEVERIEYDPNRSCYIMLVKFEDNTKNYYLAPQKIKIGDKIQNGEKIEIKVPLVIRLAGTNVEKGNKILQDSKLNYIEANTLEDAANKAVAALK